MSRKNFVSFLESDLYMKNQLLKDIDFMSMWHSIETRVPFLDKELITFIFSIQENIKFGDSMPKGILLKAFKDILSPEISSRKKMGFTFPFHAWIKNNMHIFADYLPHNDKTVSEILKGFMEGRLYWSRLWSLIVMTKWLQVNK